ncbi:divalent-cation tolerance protein CutA [Hyphomonas sp. FCG-A18]|uniref:divalent-cation tolerance protein CutA n=1 Tax=Hyphomonas sp. FCG-A18 TaxID=3080019 RepID=UPI002B2B1B93|nr:divalent-cation tolerance protein CutA [Hyphomonas sp. FCG-A18]
MSDLMLIRITCPSQRVANSIAEAAIEQRLAACANVDGPVMATYRWKGVIEQAWEFVLWFKAPAANYAKIEALTLELHPYEVPAITGMPCTHASADYEAWVKENTDV